MAKANRIEILNNMLYASVEAGIMDLASMAIEQGATLHASEDDDRCPMKAAIQTNNIPMRDMLLSKGTVVSLDTLVFGIGCKKVRDSDVTDEMVKPLVVHVNFASEVAYIHLLIAMLVKPDVEIYEEIERHFDIKKTLIARKYWLGGLFDYVRDDNDFLLSFVDDLPTSSFDFKGMGDKEILVKKRLLSSRCFKTLNYLNERGAFRTGLHFGDEYHFYADNVDDMSKEGYPVTCKFTFSIINDGMFSTNASQYFHEGRLSRTCAIFNYLEGAQSVGSDKLNKIMENLGALAFNGVSDELLFLIPYIVKSLYKKGYFESVTLSFSLLTLIDLSSKDGELLEKPVAPFMRLLLSDPDIKEALFSKKIMFTDESIDYLCLDADTCNKWLNQYPPINPILEDAVSKIKKGGTTNHYYVIKAVDTQLARLSADEREVYLSKEWDAVNVKYNDSSFITIMDDMHDILRSVNYETDAYKKIGGKWAWHIFVCPDSVLTQYFGDASDKAVWGSICKIKNKAPLFYLDKLSENSLSRRVLLELLSG